MAKRRSKRKPKLSLKTQLILLFVVILVVGALFALDYFGIINLGDLFGEQPPQTLPSTIGEDDFQIHFIEQDQYKAGDCTYIKMGTVDVLIDAGPTKEAIPTIQNYLDSYMEDDVIEYVIVTHAHEDHYAGFATPEGTQSLFDLYTVGTIIDFPKTNQQEKGLYANYLREREEEIADGASHMTALDCIQSGKPTFDLGEGVTMTVLDSYYYTHQASSENEYSVCTMFSRGENHYLFTGDLESSGEGHLVTLNNLPKMKLFKAGHHGSNTSNSKKLLDVIQPEIVVVSCVAFTTEYTSKQENTFPTQNVINRLAKYTAHVYVTAVYDAAGGEKGHKPLNGSVIVGDNGQTVALACTGVGTPLKDTQCFRDYREMPDEWN